MRRLLCLFAVLFLACGPARAQWAPDTLATRRMSGWDIAGGIAAPVVLGGAGLGIHYLGHDALEVPLREAVIGAPGHESTAVVEEVVSACRYVPVAMHLGLGLAGVPSRHAFRDRAIESAIAYLLCLGGGYVAKKAFASVRPDGSDAMSFPSGHCAIAFTGAGLLGIDYGPWWGAGGYTLAAATAAGRIWGDRHWLGDVLAGAGYGMLCAYAGYWLLDPVKKLFALPESSWDGFGTGRVRYAVAPSADPLSGGLCMSFAVTL